MKIDYIKQYMKEEREIRKMYRNWADMFLFGISAFVWICFCVMFGLSGGEGEGRLSEAPSMIGIFMIDGFWAVFALCRATFSITERNKQVNIFNKYLFVPRNAKNIFAAKLFVMLRDIGILMAAGQAVALIVNLAINRGTFVIFPETFVPLYTGIIGSLYGWYELWSNYRRAYN